jgi:hypothetical protein
MTDFPGREARLKPQFAHLYPAITAGQWDSAAVLADRMVSWLLRNPNPRIVSTARILPPEHFEFRGDAPRPDASDPGRSRREDQR